MHTLYTAVGKFEQQTKNGNSYPVIWVKDEEHLVDIHEMIIWSSLSWRFLSLMQMRLVYEQKIKEINLSLDRSFEQYLNRMLQRGLIASGSGDIGVDALYDLLHCLYIIPVCSGFLIKMFSFFKLTFCNELPFCITKKIFQKVPMTVGEKQVINLTKQTLLSTAEIIKCIDKGEHDLSTIQKVMDVLYDDEYTTCDNIGSIVKYYESRQPVILAIANLYLRKQIIFERV